VFWLGGQSDARTVRANLMVFFMLMGTAALVSYLSQGIVTADGLVLTLCLGVPFVLALWAGARTSHYASDITYRRIAYAIVALSALVSLPLFDRVFR
jgi:uncharacterized membrane protein YfcA